MTVPIVSVLEVLWRGIFSNTSSPTFSWRFNAASLSPRSIVLLYTVGMKTCLVAGGAGFIGSHLCDRLIGDGYRVVCVDNLLTGNRANISHLEDKEEFIFVQADVVEEKTYQNDLVGHYDFVFHLASPASPNQNSKMSYMAFPV